jgi:hypothetical protein
MDRLPMYCEANCNGLVNEMAAPGEDIDCTTLHDIEYAVDVNANIIKSMIRLSINCVISTLVSPFIRSLVLVGNILPSENTNAVIAKPVRITIRLSPSQPDT